MGLGTLPALAARLTGAVAQEQQQEKRRPAASSRSSRRRCYYCPSTPAVAVERGTTDNQRVVFGTLGDLSDRAGATGLKSPTLIVIGRVVALSPLWEAWEAEGRPWPEKEEQGAAKTKTAAAAGGAAGALSAAAIPCARSDLGDPLRDLGLLRREVPGDLVVERQSPPARRRQGAAAA